LSFHPQVTVVGGLDDDGRQRLLDALRALPAGTDPGWEGLVEAHGVVLDLHRENLRLLGMGHSVDVVVGPGDLPVDGYGEDYEFWVEARAASRGDGYDDWIRRWVLEIDSQDEYLRRLGDEPRAQLRAKAEPDSWRTDQATYVPDLDAPPNRWEMAASWGARHLAERVLALDAHAVLAGAGVANLAAWLAVALAREQGSEVQLTADSKAFAGPVRIVNADPGPWDRKQLPFTSATARTEDSP